MFIKEKFDENISYSNKEQFLNVFKSFESIIDESYIFIINNSKFVFYFDPDKKIYFNLNNINLFFNFN